MRPRLHFTAHSGWINDPHGITYRDGAYHVFYQYVPGSTSWAPNCHWGHATGPDLLSLAEGPVAIAPGDGDDGIWTGSLVQDGDDVRIFYTATSMPDFGIGRIRVAIPEADDWNSWQKGATVAEAPAGLDIIAYRDPFLVKEDDEWRMFVGAGLRDGTATALSYVSDDLDNWTYDGIALQRSTTETDQVWMGALWECPQIFHLGGRAVMVSSVWDDDVLHYAGYALGTYADGQFTADTWGRLTYGESYYAPSLFLDAAEQPCLSFWMRGIADIEEGWASAHSVPHRLRLEGDTLIAEPHPDVAAHRSGPVADGRTDGLGADIVWRAGDGSVAISSGGEETAQIIRTGGSASIVIGGREWSVPVRGGIRVVLDGPVLELSSDAGLFGAAISPAGDGFDIATDSAEVTVYSLV
ncbi:glycosyl hydrolase family 32 [Microbacterium mangrovi]|uniref:beta-fructofuranosidase n=1 Tax=Microbacterium mangrovi TaxID=1348253 RepID=A0A0B2A452_9MICO|nr:glycoside hydrolase family 32 protein [Microbacterium mangrovi]KHK96579.1 glycosyl hydrolase family 32 [Microbacterium mangrovi]